MAKVRKEGIIVPENIISIPKGLRTIISSPDWNIIESRSTAILDCSALQHIPHGSVYQCQEMESVLKQFPFRSGPGVYLIKILSGHTPEDILPVIGHAKQHVGRRFPYIPKSIRHSDYLYGGEVKRDFRARLIDHCGQAPRPRKHGLQLCHWAHLLGLVVEIDCFFLQPEAVNKRYLLEKQLLCATKPILGRLVLATH